MSNNYLLIDKLFKKFSKYEEITIDQFNDFYTENNNNLSRNSVRSYISELKKRDIIVKIGRGKYKLKTIKSNTELFFVITLDFINSRQYEDFDSLLEKKVKILNNTLKKTYDIDRKFYISRGDEMQILFPYNIHSYDILLLAMSIMYPFKFRYGMSIGKLESDLKDNSYEINGKILWNCRDALDKVNNKNRISSNMITKNSHFNLIANTIFSIINMNLEKITKKQWEVIKLLLTIENYSLIAEVLNINESSVYDRANKSDINKIGTALKNLYLISMNEEL